VRVFDQPVTGSAHSPSCPRTVPFRRRRFGVIVQRVRQIPAVVDVAAVRVFVMAVAGGWLTSGKRPSRLPSSVRRI
jgi:hypothetical protein